MSDNDSTETKKRFYGISDEELRAAREKRIAREQEADLLLRSARAIREDGTDMRKIKTQRLDRMRAQLSKIKHATQIMALISIIASLYFAIPHYIVKDLIEDYRYGKLTEEEKRLEREQQERQRYDGKTWDELTDPEQDYYIEYYRQKEMQEDEEVRKYGYTKESAKEYDNDLIKHLVPSWAPTIFMLFLYLGYKKRGGEHEQAAADAANFMLDWAEMGADYAINPEMLKNIMSDRFARDVIAGMSEGEALWFEMLLEGNVEVADSPAFKNMAITVMQNYLTAHPEAIVKLLEKYDRDTVTELMPAYVPQSRSYGG